MADYVTLLGAEQVSSAAATMRSAAEQMQHAASEISGALERHEQFMGQWLPDIQAMLSESGKLWTKPILCLNFDGVIHSYTSGWKGADVIPDPPVPGAIAFMLEALQHFDVVIFSSRSNQPGGTYAMIRWLREHAGSAWYESPAGPGLEDIRFVTEKPPALVTIDDRAITFTGDWPAIETLKNFKPWNKK